MDSEGIHFITTGGTIDKQYSTEKGTRSLSIGDPAIKSILEQLPTETLDYTITEVCRFDSLDMTDMHRENIRETIENSSSETFVITHGTDTMIETAKYLQNHFKSKTIILVGASLPAVFKTSDADFNIGAAVGVSTTVSSGVRILMHGQVYHPENVVKTEDGEFKSLDN